MKNCTPLKLERGNGFQKECIDILKNHSTRLTYIHHSRHKRRFFNSEIKNCNIRDDMFSCRYCTRSVCLDIQNKINFIEELYLLVRTLGINDGDNEAKVCGISIRFIRNFTDLFFIIIGEKYSMNILLNKTHCFRKMAKLTCLYGPMYLPFDDYP